MKMAALWCGGERHDEGIQRQVRPPSGHPVHGGGPDPEHRGGAGHRPDHRAVYVPLYHRLLHQLLLPAGELPPGGGRHARLCQGPHLGTGGGTAGGPPHPGERRPDVRGHALGAALQQVPCGDLLSGARRRAALLLSASRRDPPPGGHRRGCYGHPRPGPSGGGARGSWSPGPSPSRGGGSTTAPSLQTTFLCPGPPPRRSPPLAAGTPIP